ncbi:uncharacterized protein LOC144144197 isoform X1 [Haemaphysalis longicornis]
MSKPLFCFVQVCVPGRMHLRPTSACGVKLQGASSSSANDPDKKRIYLLPGTANSPETQQLPDAVIQPTDVNRNSFFRVLRRYAVGIVVVVLASVLLIVGLLLGSPKENDIPERNQSTTIDDNTTASALISTLEG